MLFVNIGGFSGSSIRTELAAGIVAACVHGPVHIGSDSKIFVDGAAVLLENLKQGRQLKRCWKLVSDGGLWEHFYEILKAKGPNC